MSAIHSYTHHLFLIRVLYLEFTSGQGCSIMDEVGESRVASTDKGRFNSYSDELILGGIKTYIVNHLSTMRRVVEIIYYIR